MITTGGTIAGEVALTLKDHVMRRSGDELFALIAPTVSYLNRRHGLAISVDTFELINVDSSDVQPDVWSALARTVKERYDDYDSFIISHGTNTLGYTCAALSFALVNPAKPIILTGSQVAIGLPGSDGQTNLENAFRVATWPSFQDPIRGVLTVFGSQIISGTRVQKDTEFAYDAFKSPDTANIGRIGRTIDISSPNLAKHTSYLSTGLWPEARIATELRCENEFDMRIASLTEFPGMSSAIFETLVERSDIQGFILRAFGAGDPSTRHRAAFASLKEHRIPLVVASQAQNGNSNFQVNEPGEYLRQHQLAIPAFDMTIEAQTTKLGWLLAKKAKGEMTYDHLCEQMVNDMRGEISVLWETGF